MASQGTVLNLDIDAGMDYYLDTYYVDYTTNLPKDITGYSALMEVRSGVENPIPYLVLSSADGRILLGGDNGSILVRFTAEDTNPNLQPLYWTRAVYDLIITDRNGIRTKLLKGFINITGTCSMDYAPLINWEFLAPLIANVSTGNLTVSIT